jgi:RNA polymerase sigma-70 factor, ECF subfamily
MTTSDDLTDLISRTALGDRAAFRALYDRTNAKLFGVCLRIFREQQEAENALQEIYIKVWQRADRFAQGQASPMTWLITVARNHCIDIVRARKIATDPMDAAAKVADPAPGPERDAINRDERSRIGDCMAEIEPDRARAVQDAYIEGYSYAELAERHGVPINTMRTWLRRSLIKLKECLER